jgi:hypothetical protein
MLVFSDFQNGRFGNKLFQIAATIATSVKNNINYGFYGNFNYEFMFSNLKLPQAIKVPEKKYYEYCFEYYDICIQEPTNFFGFYQSEKFFENIKQQVLDMYDFNKKIENELVAKYSFIKDSCSIHVRRTDYLNQQSYHPVLPLNYFKKALELTDCKKFTVFSDDINWCKENFKGDEFSFINLKDYEDFILMANCKDNIITNSTFSWWAAYLNKTPNKKTICPVRNKWFGPSYASKNTKDIYPSNWIEVLYES